jgi:OOP family OmpA-OmpF porin
MLLAFVGCATTPEEPAAPAVAPAPRAAPAPAPVAAPAAAPAKPAAPKPEKVTTASAVNFDFDRYVIRPDARGKLDDLVGKLRNVNLEVIIAVGHADRLGGDGYNMKLSVRRADSVKAYLVSKGVAASRVYTEGKGERQPVKDCKGEGRNKELISCLEPNRRAELEAVGSVTKK